MLVLARIAPGRTYADVEGQFVRDAPDELAREARSLVRLVPLASVFGTPTVRTVVIAGGRAGYVVGALAALVLVAGCATLMAMALVHYERRRRELCVRLALGASQGRLVRDLVRELVLPAAAGASAALLLAVWSLRALPSLSLPGGIDLSRLDLSIDWRVLAAAIAATILTLATAAIVPVARFTRSRLAGELVGSTSTAPASSHRLRQGLLAVHVSATIVVLVAAGLFVRAVTFGFSTGAGFDVDRTAFVQVQTAPPFVGADLTAVLARARADVARVEDGLREIPSVIVVARGRSPLGPDSSQIWTRKIETADGLRDVRIGAMSEGPNLLDALGVPIVRGRGLTPADAQARPVRVVLTQSLARALWPGEDPIGKNLVQIIGERRTVGSVVGIAADFAYGSLGETTAGVLVGVSALAGNGRWVIRTESEATTVVSAIERRVREVVPDAPRVTVTTGRAIVTTDLARQRLGAWFFSGFGLVALTLGLGGVFGLVAYLAESRRREFGVRLALGATPRQLIQRGMMAGIGPVVVGAAAGLAAAAVVARGLISLLPGLGVLDPITYASVGALMVGGAVAASLAAAWPLLRVSPSEALRAE
jgi:predicted permease